MGWKEMVQWLRALAALPEDWVQFPAHTWHLTLVYNCCSRGSDTLTQTYMYQNTNAQEINYGKNPKTKNPFNYTCIS